METKSGPRSTSVNDVLEKTPQQLDFFQAVKLLHGRRERVGSPPKKPVGFDYPPDEEVVNFGASASLSFPATEITQLADVDKRPKMDVSFLGLQGPSGELPLHYTELLLEQQKERNQSMRLFFDIFNHRSVSFYYRAWQKYHVASDTEQADVFKQAVFSLLGVNPQLFENVLTIPPDKLLYYAGYFATQRRNKSALQNMLEDFLGVPVEVEQLQGEWLPIDEDDWAVLPDVIGAGRNNCLGVDFVIGSEVFCVENRFEIVVGPLDREQADSLAPNSIRQKELCDLVNLYVGKTFQYDIRYLIRTDTRPRWEVESEQAYGFQLGWNTWLPGTPRDVALDEVVIPYSALHHSSHDRLNSNMVFY